MAWNGSDGKTSSWTDPKRHTCRRSHPWLCICTAAVVLSGSVLLWICSNRPAGNAPKNEREYAGAKKTRHVEPAAPRRAKHAEAAPTAKPAKEKPAAKKEEWEMPSVLQSEQIEEGLVLCEVPSNMPSHARNPYKSQVESILSMLGKPGTPYTPVPIDPNMDMDADFIKALENTIVIWEDESEQSAQHKQLVNWMKQAVEDARKEGWKVGDLLRELEKERKHQWEMLSQAQTILSETEETSPQHTATVRKSLNKELDQIGVDPIPQTETEDSVVQEELK